MTATAQRRFPDGSIRDPDRCLICHLDQADEAAVVFRDPLWACEVAPGFEVPGWFFLRARRHALGWSGLRTPELTSFGPVVQDLMCGLEAVFDAPARYLMTFGEAYPHFHCIVTVRGDEVPPDRRSGNILGLLSTSVDRTAALAHVPGLRSAYEAIARQHAGPARTGDASLATDHEQDEPGHPSTDRAKGTKTTMSNDTMTDDSALKVDDEQFSPTTAPQTPRNRATGRPIIAPSLHHTTFTTLRLDEMVAWYELAVGMMPAFWGEDAAWLTNDAANHRIAFLSPPGLKHPQDKGHTTGVHHTAFEFGTFDQWLDNYIRLRNHGVLPWLTLDHGITMSVYYQDPDGNGVEIQVDGFGDWADSKQWISSSLEFATNPIGTYFDPEKLVQAREQGLKFEEIHRRARAGEYLPDTVPDNIFLPDLY